MSTTDERLADLLDRAVERDMAATSQLISALEGRRVGSGAVLEALHRAGGNAHVVGVTGAPGSGKSTLVSVLARELRDRGLTVAIVAVDPSSAISGGAILGDRIRMQDHALDPGIFVRSMSSRGSLGGVSAATVDAVGVLDAAGWDVVVVETVGVGQAEVEIMRIAQTVVVVSVPGLGDDVQAIKAGLMEIADLHVVNKADRPDAGKTVAELLSMLTLAGPPGPGGWPVPVLSTSAADSSGVPKLADTLAEHRAWMAGSGEGERRERAMAAARIHSIAKDLVLARLADPSATPLVERVVAAVAARRLDPHAAARALVDNEPITDLQLEKSA
ncbi:methylmalonyl Co-A mutase-associated GTPase MeaB [Conexibacter sp. JD483]|uniref:methylmalonyl Co-A mutase-associated GTPase MeaB n=1 Tax=unclassified Conexibacter TaxID=2627773 RepID=UPI0027224F28|nr:MULTISPECIES: methylmalonyl Co-A mutase-associated GTPase MeaB [unclassified Conexibacter]MDO8187941.1 methylmalonyl Co-A mutase-associated GTPase MeaB [Conexibacter sp. CPCC 205706]MDO8200190.1 methylmalonyl Co-A mutase-associated GTPase MeaB [Conexibacter sp. CPCC 205762]MDR9369736.1 methylmalonyl Co-A mutase-associated GTPase MeaB [Conexibacter sp. JD483]